jgi:hypothetical protein
MLALHLLQNCMVYVNTLMRQLQLAGMLDQRPRTSDPDRLSRLLIPIPMSSLRLCSCFIY